MASRLPRRPLFCLRRRTRTCVEVQPPLPDHQKLISSSSRERQQSSLFLILLHLPLFLPLATAMHLLLLFLLLFFRLALSAHLYDPSSCSLNVSGETSGYTCGGGGGRSCDTFVVYRAQKDTFNTISSISVLFGVSELHLLSINNLTDPSLPLSPGREVDVPILCSCNLAGNFQSNLSYPIAGDSPDRIACDVFEGMCKSRDLAAAAQNTGRNGSPAPEKEVVVPVRCACPDYNETQMGFKYLVTYPIVEFDDLTMIAGKFGVAVGDVLAANGIGSFTAIYPETTILVPLRSSPSINVSSGASAGKPVVPAASSSGAASWVKLKIFIGASASVFFAFLVILVVMRKKKKNIAAGEGKKISGGSGKSSTPMSCLSPELVASFSKYSLTSYTTAELREATGGFGEAMRLGDTVHRGKLAGGEEVAVKRIGNAGDARRVIGIHSAINHSSIVKLQGVCYGDGEVGDPPPPCYLVFEFAHNGCLKECLREKPRDLPWRRRTQIAFDVAVGLHYIHQCVTPPYVHMRVSSRSIVVTGEWRAKIANLGVGSGGAAERWAAPEYLWRGEVSAKVDVFAFGVVIFELISGKTGFCEADIAGDLCFLFGGGEGGGSVTGCFEELRAFVDPDLRSGIPIGEALCLAVLAKTCVDDNPSHRPSMDDILKVLARMACPN